MHCGNALWENLEKLSAAGKDAKGVCGMPYMLMTRDLCGVQSTVAQHCLLLPAVGGCDISCGVLHGRCVLPGIRLHSHPCVFAPRLPISRDLPSSYIATWTLGL